MKNLLTNGEKIKKEGKMKKLIFMFCSMVLVFSLCIVVDYATGLDKNIIKVPDDYPTIQSTGNPIFQVVQ